MSDCARVDTITGKTAITSIGETIGDHCRYTWLIRPCITREARVSALVADSGLAFERVCDDF